MLGFDLQSFWVDDKTLEKIAYCAGEKRVNLISKSQAEWVAYFNLLCYTHHSCEEQWCLIMYNLV